MRAPRLWPPAALAALTVLAPATPFTVPGPALAQTLPVRTYGVRDGLAHARVNSIFQDAKGYLWFCTWEGLSRFDGHDFVNYGVKDGLSSALLNDMAADSRGRLWVALHHGGVARFVDDPAESTAHGAAFVTTRVGASRESNVIYQLLAAADGSLWCLAQAGVFRAAPDSSGAARFAPVALGDSTVGAMFRLASPAGEIGFLCETEIIASGPRGVVRWPRPDSARGGDHSTCLADQDGRVLISNEEQLWQFTPPALPGAQGSWKRLPVGLSHGQYILAIFRDAGGTLWLGTRRGLARYNGERSVTYTRAQGLSDDWIRCVSQDREGNLWVGTTLGGLDKLPPGGMVSYARGEGLADANVLRVVESRDGRIYASTQLGGIAEIRAGDVRVVPGSDRAPFSNVAMRFIQDRRGDWWLGTDRGVWRFDGPELQFRRGHKFGRADGAPEVEVFGALHEDPAGRIWFGGANGHLYCVDRAGGADRVQDYDLVRAGVSGPPREFLDDKAGALWLSPYVGIWKLRAGRFDPFRPAAGIPDPDLNSRFLFTDSRGWLWIGTRFNGVSVTREPEAEHPSFRNYSTATGLASDAVWCITEDAQGRMYLGTARGVDRLDPATDAVHHFTAADGLAGDIVNFLFRDSRGFIWAATTGGLSRLNPRAATERAPPSAVYVTRVEVAGEPRTLARTGATRVAEFNVPSGRNNLTVDFAGIGFGAGELRYQWKLDGADRDWSRPMAMRSVQYARLAPGRYRFEVRAVTEEGSPSSASASVAFRVLPPAWEEPWFVALVVAAAVSAAYALHRARVRRALAMERIRRQIATDLHDDIGSGLSQIAVLGEVAKRGADPSVGGHLDEMTSLARAMRESMSDIVWSVDPRKDHLSDLLQRMRQVAANLLEARGIEVALSAPHAAEFERIALSPDRRRHIYLIFKEALTNVTRHAEASRVEIRIVAEGGRFELVIEDDGRGFERGGGSQGHGLESLAQRARELGGELTVGSTPGRGTRVRLRAPLH